MKFYWRSFKAWCLIFIFFIGLVGHIFVLIFRLLLTGQSRRRTVKFNFRKRFCRFSNWIFGVKINLLGTIPDHGTYLFVSNHRSFYDPLAFLSRIIANPVSKAEISSYPIIGWGSNLTEVILVDRSNRQQRGITKKLITESLINGSSILIYPEGTTSDLEYTRDFKIGSFSSAIEAKVPVIPVSIEYKDEDEYWTERSLYKQFVQHFSPTGKTDIYMFIGNPIIRDDPKELLKETRNKIEKQIEKLRDYRNKS